MKIKIKYLKDRVIVLINNYIFFQQEYLISDNKNISNKLYTYFYILLVLNRFGFVNIKYKKNRCS